MPPTKKAKRAKKLSTKEQKNVDVKKLEKDINFILNDDITTAESDKQISSGAVSPTNNVQSPKRSSKRGNMRVNDKKLTNDVDFVFKHDIPAVESNSQIAYGKVPSKKIQKNPGNSNPYNSNNPANSNRVSIPLDLN